MPTDPTPRRRLRLQFGLGTLLAAVTVVAVLVAYHINWIRERREFLSSSRSDRMTIGYTVCNRPHELPKAPLFLRIFGEYGCEKLEIAFPSANTKGSLSTNQERELARIKRLFPEASEIRWVLWDMEAFP